MQTEGLAVANTKASSKPALHTAASKINSKKQAEMQTAASMSNSGSTSDSTHFGFYIKLHTLRVLRQTPHTSGSTSNSTHEGGLNAANGCLEINNKYRGKWSMQLPLAANKARAIVLINKMARQLAANRGGTFSTDGAH